MSAIPKPEMPRAPSPRGEKVEWGLMAQSPAFRAIIRRKKRFISAACVFFIVYYFALPALVGFAPDFMATPVWGQVNLAYLFALSQFFMAWILAGLYVRFSGRIDQEIDALLKNQPR